MMLRAHKDSLHKVPHCGTLCKNGIEVLWFNHPSKDFSLGCFSVQDAPHRNEKNPAADGTALGRIPESRAGLRAGLAQYPAVN